MRMLVERESLMPMESHGRCTGACMSMDNEMRDNMNDFVEALAGPAWALSKRGGRDDIQFRLVYGKMASARSVVQNDHSMGWSWLVALVL